MFIKNCFSSDISFESVYDFRIENAVWTDSLIMLTFRFNNCSSAQQTLIRNILNTQHALLARRNIKFAKKDNPVPLPTSPTTSLFFCQQPSSVRSQPRIKNRDEKSGRRCLRSHCCSAFNKAGRERCRPFFYSLASLRRPFYLLVAG